MYQPVIMSMMGANILMITSRMLFSLSRDIMMGPLSRSGLRRSISHLDPQRISLNFVIANTTYTPKELSWRARGQCAKLCGRVA